MILEIHRKGDKLMKHTNLKPFMRFGVMIVVVLFIGTGFLAMIFSGGGDVGSGVAYRGWGRGVWAPS